MSEELRKLKVRKDLIDPPLNSIGISQATNGQKYINKVNFKYVFVSPMVRTMMTTINLFASHPNKSDIKFILVPMAKEGLHLCNDLTRSIEYLQAKFGDPEQCRGIMFDFSMCFVYGNQNVWGLNVLGDLNTQKLCYSIIDANKAQTMEEVND